MSLIRCHLLLVLLVVWRAPSCLSVQAPSAVNIENDVLHFSYELERWLDTEQRPCQDFFAYVCSKSLNTTQVQLEKRLQHQQERFDKFLSAGGDNDDQLLDAEYKLKQFYDSCKNARSLEDLRNSLMYRLSGGWPAIDDGALMLRKRRNMTWMGVLGAFHDVGVEYIFRHRIEMKSNKRLVHLQPDESLRYTLRKFEQLAGEVMQQYAVVAGRSRLVALEILNFERNRREIVKAESTKEVREFSYEDFKTYQFGSAQQIDWDSYFRKILGKPLKATDTVLVAQLPKMVQLFELLQNTTMTRLLNWIWIDYLMDKGPNDCQSLAESLFEPVYQHIVERSSIDKVQMAQMYSDIGRAYEELLPSTPWIDEMSQQNSKLFIGRIMHLTLNGLEKLDADYKPLTITKRNFYRNLEKVQRFVADERKSQISSTRLTGSSRGEMTQAAVEYMKIFLTINCLLQQQNLTTPLNYALVGERFAEHMIAGGSISASVPGAWRSMDSERHFLNFKQCIGRQSGATVNYNLNDLIMKMLAQHQTFYAYEQWLEKDAPLISRLDTLLHSGRLQLSMRKLYFVGTVLADCRHYPGAEQKEFVHSYLKNSQEFTKTFGCRASDELHVRNVCKVIQGGGSRN